MTFREWRRIIAAMRKKVRWRAIERNVVL